MIPDSMMELTSATHRTRRSTKARIWSGDFLGTALIPVALGKAAADVRGRVLDLGCGNRPYRDLFTGCDHYVGYDLDRNGSRPDVVGTTIQLPFAGSVFDAIVCTQVLEHVADPILTLKEASRVLKPGGRLVLTAPQYWRLHEEPHDYFRFTRFGLAHLLGQVDLEVELIEPQGGVWRLVGQAVNSAVYQRCGSNVATHVVFVLINLLALGMERVWFDARDTLNYFVTARKPVLA